MKDYGPGAIISFQGGTAVAGACTGVGGRVAAVSGVGGRFGLCIAKKMPQRLIDNRGWGRRGSGLFKGQAVCIYRMAGSTRPAHSPKDRVG